MEGDEIPSRADNQYFLYLKNSKFKEFPLIALSLDVRRFSIWHCRSEDVLQVDLRNQKNVKTIFSECFV